MEDDIDIDFEIKVVFSVNLKKSEIIEKCDDIDKKKELINLFQLAEDDNMTGDELEKLKTIIKEVAQDKIDLSIHESPKIYESELDILIE